MPKLEIKDGKATLSDLPANITSPPLSKSQKTRLVTAESFKTELPNGKQATVQVNIYIPAN